MSRWTISTAALRMAWRMVETVFPRHGVSRRDREQLLTFATLLALEDLKQRGLLQCKGPFGPLYLALEGNSVGSGKAEGRPLALRHTNSARDQEHAFQALEEILGRYPLEETEIATLYTALPCLGLQALEKYLCWKEEPPFPELE